MPATIDEFKRAFSGKVSAQPAPGGKAGQATQPAGTPGGVINVEAALLQLKKLVDELAKSGIPAARFQTGMVKIVKGYADAMNAVAPMKTIEAQLLKVYDDAKSMIAELEGLLGTYREYAKVRDVALSKYAECWAIARSYLALFPERANLQSYRYSMFDAAKKGDFANATAFAKQIETKAAEYLKACVAEQKQYDELGAKILKSIKDASWFNEDNVTRDWVKKMTPDQIRFLPTKVRNRMMEELHEGVYSDDDKKAMLKLYSVRSLDPDFEKAEKLKRDAYIEKLQNDPEFKKARKDWAIMDKDQKMKLLEKAANYHAEAYGTKDAKEARPLKVKAYNKEPEKDSAGNVTKWNNGVYNPATGTITVNTNSYSKVDFNNFDTALDLITHEAGHRYQEVLADRVKNGKLKPGDAEYNQAVSFMWNDKDYINEPQHIYETQPMESHSRVSGAAVQAANIGGTT